MNTKLLLLLGAAVVGLLLLFTLGPSQESSVSTISSELVDAGRFVLMQRGVPILEESYTIEFHPANGYLLNSQGAIAVNGQAVQLAQQTQYDRNFMPVQYQLATETPAGTQIISAQMGMRGFEMSVQVGLSIQSAQVVEVENLALLDNNLISQFAVLLMAIRAEALDRTFTAAIPQVLLSLPARVDGPNSVTFYSGGQAFEGKQFDLQLGDTGLSLIEVDGHLAALVNHRQSTLGYDMTLFPEGITLEEAPEPVDETAVERDVIFASGDLSLEGTLRLPLESDGPVPAVVFLHGSGPIDRDGNAVDVGTGTVVMELDAQRQLAVALSEVGIASFRYDKRGVGASEGSAALSSRADLLRDAAAALEAVREQPEIEASQIILIGHSEGSYLAPALAAEDNAVAGVILLAGAARSLADITRWQVETLLVQSGAEGEILDAQLNQQDQYMAFVKRSEGEWSDYSTEDLIAEVPWLNEPAAEQMKGSLLALSWLREHYNATPAEDLARVTAPVLVISGEKDAQVPSSEAALIEQVLQEAGNGDITISVLPDLNHLLRHHPEEPNLTFRHLNEPVDSRVLQAIQDWVSERYGR